MVINNLSYFLIFVSILPLQHESTGGDGKHVGWGFESSQKSEHRKAEGEAEGWKSMVPWWILALTVVDYVIAM